MPLPPVAVALSLLLSTTSALGALPAPGAEQPVGTPVAAPAGGVPSLVAAASNRAGTVVTWTNRGSCYVSGVPLDATTLRDHPSRLPSCVSALTTVGERIVGLWLADSTIFVGPLEKPWLRPAAAVEIAPDERVAAFVSNDSQAMLVVAGARVRARLFGPDGQPESDWHDLGPKPSPPPTWGLIAAAADPAGFAVVMNVEQPQSDAQSILFHRVTQSGVSGPFAVAVSRGWLDRMAVVFDGARYLVVSQDASTIHGLFVSPAGTIEGQTFPIASSQYDLHTVVPKAGGGSLVVLHSSGLGSYEGVGVDPTGHTSGEPVEIGVSAASGAELHRVVAAGDRLLAIFTRSHSILHGTARRRTDLMARWLDLPAGTSGSEPFLLSVGAPEQTRPAVALGPDVDFITWEEMEVDGLTRIRAVRLAHDGTALDRTPLRLPAAPGRSSLDPAIAFDGRVFIVVWSEFAEDVEGFPVDGRLLAMRFAQDGTPVDEHPIVVHDDVSWSPAVASLGGTTLIVWGGVDRAGADTGIDILGARLDPEGALLDPTPFVLSRGPVRHARPTIAAGDEVFLVGWRRQYYEIALWYRAWMSAVAATVTPGGTVGPPLELVPPGTANIASEARVAWNGSTFIAAWHDMQGGSWQSAHRASAITSSGNTGQSAVISFPSAAAGGFPVYERTALAFVRGWWIVVSPNMEHAYLTADLDVRAVTHGFSGTQPAIASDGSRAVLVYQRAVMESPHNGSQTIFVRTYRETGPTRRRAARH